MGSEYNRVQVIMLEQLHKTFEHDTAHLSRDEQISLAIAAANSFNSVASDLLAEPRQQPAPETPAAPQKGWCSHDFHPYWHPSKCGCPDENGRVSGS
jgi:hypothetical protein